MDRKLLLFHLGSSKKAKKKKAAAKFLLFSLLKHLCKSLSFAFEDETHLRILATEAMKPVL